MELTIDRNTLSTALSHLHGITAKKTTVPILGHILLEATPDILCLSATDLDVAIKKDIQASVKKAGSATVSSALIHEIVKKLPKDSSVSLCLDEESQQLLLKSGRSLFKLSSLNPVDFPSITIKSLPHQFLLPAVDFIKLIEK